MRFRFNHDVATYLAAKPKDIPYSPSAIILDSPPFIEKFSSTFNEEDLLYPSLDPRTTCPIFKETGDCRWALSTKLELSWSELHRHGLKCRFLGSHVKKDESGDLILVEDEEKKSHAVFTTKEMNYAGPEVLKLLRSKKVQCMFYSTILRLNLSQYPRPITDVVLRELQAIGDSDKATSQGSKVVPTPEQDEKMQVIPESIISQRTGEDMSDVDTADVPVRFAEKKRLNWAGKTCALLFNP
jgi:tRNA-dihydrouridine synthase 3